MSILIKIADLDLADKIVLVREDYNVPLTNGVIRNDSRIKATLPTLKQLLEARAKVILVSHLGRPIAGEYDAELSLAPVAKALSVLLGIEVPLIKDWINGIDFKQHQIVLCENVRFEQGEIEDDDALARKMAQLCHVYVNDAFATAHRAQASTHGIAKYVSVAAAGPLLINELKSLNIALKEPAEPVLAIVAGAKVSSKLTLLAALSKKVDQLIVGGGIANTFLKAAGHHIGLSLYEPDLVDTAKQIMRDAEQNACQIPLPIDVVCGKTFAADTTATTKSIDAVQADDLIMDIGFETAQQFQALICQAKTIIWNGPLGVFEFEAFSHGTQSLANAIADSDAYSIAGGGDTIAAIDTFGVRDQISYISTGGGAFLEIVEDKTFPAIEILQEAARAWAAMERAREL